MNPPKVVAIRDLENPPKYDGNFLASTMDMVDTAIGLDVKHLEDAVRIVDAARWKTPVVPFFAHQFLDRVELHLNTQISDYYKTYFADGE